MIRCSQSTTNLSMSLTISNITLENTQGELGLEACSSPENNSGQRIGNNSKDGEIT